MPEPLKVLIILENAGAGSGRHVVDLASGLLRRGHEVGLIYSTLRLDVQFAHAIENCDGLRTYCVDMVRGPSFNDASALRRIRSIIVEEQPPWNIIHGHSSKGGALARLGGILTPAARIYTPHAFYTMDPGLPALKRRFYALVERSLSSISHAIVCVSQVERSHALSLGIPASKLVVIQNCLSGLPAADRAAARRQLGVSDEEVCIGFVGRLVRQKYVDRLLLAFQAVAAEHQFARLAIVGAGPEQEQLKDFARDLKVFDRVIWTGEADGPALMSGFDVFALPSLYEGFPYVLLEAAARGLPIVTTRVGGAEEVVHNGVNGFVVDDTQQFIDMLCRLVRDAPERKSMGTQSLDIVTSFTVDRMITETLELYRRMARESD